MISIDLPNSAISAHINESTLPHGDDNILFSTAQSSDFGVTLYDATKCHGVKNNSVDWFISMNFGKSIMYVPI